MSRISKLILAGFLMLGPLAGCSNQANTESTTETAEKADTDKTEESKDTKTAEAAKTEIGTASDKTTAYTVKNESGAKISELSINGGKNLLTKDIAANDSVVWNLEKPADAASIKIKADGKDYEVKDVKFNEIDDKSDVRLVKNNDGLGLTYKNIGGKDVTLAFTDPAAAKEENKEAEQSSAPAQENTPSEPASESAQNYSEPATDTNQAYSEPAYQEPAYQEPAYQEPAYQEPAYQEPAYQQPAAQEPSYSVPSQSQDGCLGESALIPSQSQDGCLGESALIPQQSQDGCLGEGALIG